VAVSDFVCLFVSTLIVHKGLLYFLRKPGGVTFRVSGGVEMRARLRDHAGNVPLQLECPRRLSDVTVCFVLAECMACCTQYSAVVTTSVSCRACTRTFST
jgi:hypothetical protein